MSEQTVEENLELVTFIQLTRIYDVLMTLLALEDEKKAQALHDLHERGDFITPPPAIAPPS